MSTLADDLQNLSSAEDFFAYFNVPFDRRILAACRLHILKRFHDGLGAVAGLDARDDATQHAIYREQLAQAYADFTHSPALSQGVFPRLKKVQGAFVSLSAVRQPYKRPGQV